MNAPIQDRAGAAIAGGRYRLDARIGEGTLGRVYRATDLRAGARVVVKFPIAPAGEPGSAGLLERFRREARALVRLAHPHVVPVIEAGEEGGVPYLVMPELDGGSLKARLEPGAGGEPRPMPAELLHGWLPGVAGALDFLHGLGHVHRDVKPANILFDRAGTAFLGDFGVIKVPGAGPEPGGDRGPLSTPGYLLGTPNYVAPELIAGRPADGRADQYALALTVHEALTGWNFMEGPDSPATLANQARAEPPRLVDLLSDFPARTSAAVARGLAKDPAGRFASCAAMAAEALAEVPPPVAGRAPRPAVPRAPESRGEPGRVPCPACGGLLPVVPEHDGRRVTCTRCHATAVVHLAAGTLRLRLVAPPPPGISDG